MDVKTTLFTLESLIPRTFLANLKLAAGMIILIALIMSIYVWSEKQVDIANNLRIQSHELSDEFRQSSDDLTRMVRTYVVTGEPRYKEYYQDIIDIRNGKIPRPQNYGKVYWDFVLTGEIQPNIDGTTQAVALLELMKQAGFPEQELQKLSVSKAHSDKLTEIEFNAMTLLETSIMDNKINALSMLYGNEYHLAKSAIMSPVNDVIFMANDRTNLAISNAKIIASILRMSLIVFTLGLGFILFRLYSIMKGQLGASISEVQAEIARIGNAELTPIIDVPAGKENSVFGWLAKMQANLIELEEQRKLSEESEARANVKYHTLFHASGDAILMLNEKSFFDCNQAALNLFGSKSQEELCSYSPTDLSPPSQACGTDSKVLAQRYIDTAVQKGTVNFEWIHRRIDSGTLFVTDIVLTSLMLDGQPFLQTTIRDITERKQIEQREKSRTRIFDLLARAEPISTILDEIVKLVEQEKKSSLCSILLLDHEGQHLISGSAPSLPDFYNEAINGVEIGEGVGSCGTAAFTQKRVIVEDIQTHPYWTHYKQLAAKANLGSCWSQPIWGAGQEVLGTFAIYHHNTAKPKSSDIELIEFVAQLTSIAIERSQANEQLQLSSRVFNNTHEGIIITNAQKKIVDVNPAFSEITGYRHEEVIGQNPSILSSGKQNPAFYAEMWQQINALGHWQGEIWNRRKDGELYAELMTISTLLDDNDNIINYVGMFTDITSSKQQQEKLNLMAHYDILTGLPNRALFVDRFHQAIAHSNRRESLLAVCFLDLDNFKPINDNYGHEVGDQLLVEVAQRITQSIREEDTVSRQGGDEFTLLLNDIESQDQCEHTLERITHALAQPYLINNTPHKITASIGVTLYPSDDEDVDTLIRHADNAMYQAKQSGKHRYHIFDSSHDKQLVQKHNKLDEIQQALINNEFSLYYQPKVNMRTGEVFGAEALIRWHHPEKGLIPPLDFLPLIDASDLELQVGDWVINQALQQMDRWLAQGVKLEVSVNIASHHLQSDSFFANLEATLAKYRAVDSAYLQLEILESSALSDLQTISHIIKTCQEAFGVSVALDDFGTGYSSLTHLRSLTANTIKIDQSFVRDMLDDPNDYTIIDGIIGLADSFGREVIAEGVETTEHGLMLLMMGCEEAQGYGIARPLPADDFHEWLSSYTPNQEWLICGNKVRTVKENKIKLFRLITEHWKHAFISKVLSSPEDDKHWPIMSEKNSPCGQWIKRAYKEGLFDKGSLKHIESTHDNVHFIAQAIQFSYQEGDIEKARDAIEGFISTYNEMSNAIGQCE